MDRLLPPTAPSSKPGTFDRDRTLCSRCRKPRAEKEFWFPCGSPNVNCTVCCPRSSISTWPGRMKPPPKRHCSKESSAAVKSQRPPRSFPPARRPKLKRRASRPAPAHLESALPQQPELHWTRPESSRPPRRPPLRPRRHCHSSHRRIGSCRQDAARRRVRLSKLRRLLSCLVDALANACLFKCRFRRARQQARPPRSRLSRSNARRQRRQTVARTSGGPAADSRQRRRSAGDRELPAALELG